MQYIVEQILTKIKKAKRGALFFADSIVNFGSAKSVNKALERLVKSGEIDRVATGIYVRPKINQVVGKIFPTIVAHRDKFSHLSGVDYSKHKPQFIHIILPEKHTSALGKGLY